MRKPLYCLLAVAAASAIWACSNDSTGPEALTGAYTLQTIGGKSLPVVVDEGAIAGLPYRDEVLSATLDVDASIYRQMTHSRVTSLGNTDLETDEETGRWERLGDEILFTDLDGSRSRGTGQIGKGTISWNGSGGLWVFRK